MSEDLIKKLDPQQAMLLKLLEASHVQLVNYLQKLDAQHTVTVRSPLITFEDLTFIKTHTVNALYAIPIKSKSG